MVKYVDIVIVGTGAAGLFCALNLGKDKEILIITKREPEDSNSFLAQGGICVKRDSGDYDSFYEDTMKAGHYHNSPEAVDMMISHSREVIGDLLDLGVDFTEDNGELSFTREGGHSRPRILYHEDQTGKEITSTLLRQVRRRKNITIMDHVNMVDLLIRDRYCMGIVAIDREGNILEIRSRETVMATGGIGGLYENSTNFSHITGDALNLALAYDILLKDMQYIQIHPTTLYDKTVGRRFLISESVRGEGAVLYNKSGKRFVDELIPRDLLTQAIYREMEREGTPHVWLSMEPIGKEEIKRHFPNIYSKCLERGIDVTKEWIPVVPAQHYCMGGIAVDICSRTSMAQLYAVGEVSCNGVHGANRLASNSLLESLVFSKSAARQIESEFKQTHTLSRDVPDYRLDIDELYRRQEAGRRRILDEIKRVAG